MFPPSGRVPLDLRAPKPQAATRRGRFAWVTRHRAFLFAMLALASTRAFLLLVVRPNGYFASNSDYDFYFQFARLSNLGLYPFLNYWLEYPPLFPWLAVLIYRLSLLIPPMPYEPIFWFRLLLGGVFYLFDLANLTLVYLIASEIHRRRLAWQAAAIYGSLLVPLYTWLAWFDTLPLFFLMASVWLLLRRRLYLASAVAGVGFMVKILPILVLPVAARLESTWRRRILLTLPAVLMVLVLAFPFLMLAPQYLLASFQSMVHRSSWETVWALIEGYFSFGIVAPLAERVDPASATYANHDDWIPYPLVMAGFAALYYWVWRRKATQPAPLHVVLLGGLTVNLYLLANKGYSPQFLVYALPFLILTMPNWRGLGYATALTTANLVEWPIYHTMFGGAAWVLVVAVLLRTLLLIVISIEYTARLLSWTMWIRLSQPMLRMGAILLVVGGVAGAYLGIQQWYALRYEQDRLSGAFAFVRDYSTAAGVALVFSDDELYSRFYPFFHDRADLYLLRPARDGDRTILSDQLTPAERRARLAQILREHRQVWIVRYADDWRAIELSTWLSKMAQIVASDYIAKDGWGNRLDRRVVLQLWTSPINVADPLVPR